MKNKLTAILYIYIFLSIIAMPILILNVGYVAGGLDIMLAFFICSLVSIINTIYRGLNTWHLVLFIGFVGLIICSILLFFEDTYLAYIIGKYGMILVPIAFIIVPVYTFIISPNSKYNYIKKSDCIETEGICIDYDYSYTKGNTVIKAYTPIYEVNFSGKKLKLKDIYYSAQMKKIVPMGTKTKVLINKNDYTNFFIYRTKKMKKKQHAITISFGIIGIIAIILMIINGF